MSVNVRKINHERLGRWEKRLNENHSTAVVLVGIGYDQVKGRVMVLNIEDITDEEVIVFLRETLRQLEKDFASKQ